ncbi:Gfo/Idh/MocA family oxidoreductase [Candidatus Bipolaricaulota bacterium]|nr:Gfo/Idh/MocA family oxidoreductase [Candidatus Bipolaricaulota bacterium]
MISKGKAKWGILGTANIAGKALVPGIRDSKNSELYAVGSRAGSKAQRFAEKFDIPESYGSYKSLLDDPKVEFVYIPLPNHLHHKWTIESAKKGKHVLCEKPLGLNSKEVREMFEVADEHGVKLMEGFMYRFHPQVLRVKELLQEGEIGEPTFFRGAFSFPLVAQDREDDIRWKKEMGGGSLMDLGTYSVNTVRYLFDEEPNRVFARDRKHSDHSAEAETQAILEFPDGKTATLDSSFLLSKRANYEVVSKNGRIRASNAYGPGQYKRLNVEIEQDNSTVIETLEGVNEYALEVDELVNAVSKDRKPMVTKEDSINQARVLDAIKQSAKEERWTEV